MSPVDLLDKLSEHLVKDRTAPDQGLLLAREESDRHRFDPVPDDRDHLFVPNLGHAGDSEHWRDRGAVDVGVHDADLVA